MFGVRGNVYFLVFSIVSIFLQCVYTALIMRKNEVILVLIKRWQGFPGGAVVESLPANAGTRVRALVWEDPTCRGATRPVSHNY